MLTLALDSALMKEISLVFFVVFWLVILLRLVLTRSDRYRKTARIPLEDETVIEPRTGRDFNSNPAGTVDNG